jgi:geranylgeranyl pyrophosphate synthase
MVGGQTLDLSLKSTDPGELGDMHDRKTGALFAAACEMGALAAGAGASTCRLAGQYGQDLGRAFQATDDLLDVTGDAGTLGKTPGKDRTLSRPTLVAAHGLEKAQAKARDFGEAARESLKALGWGPDHMAGFFVEFVLSRRN